MYFVDITHLSWPLRALRWRKLITCCQDSIRINAGEGFDKNSIVLHSRGMDVSQISHKAITLQKGELQKYGPDYPHSHIWRGALSSFGQNVKMQLHALEWQFLTWSHFSPCQQCLMDSPPLLCCLVRCCVSVAKQFVNGGKGFFFYCVVWHYLASLATSASLALST